MRHLFLAAIFAIRHGCEPVTSIAQIAQKTRSPSMILLDQLTVHGSKRIRATDRGRARQPLLHRRLHADVYRIEWQAGDDETAAGRRSRSLHPYRQLPGSRSRRNRGMPAAFATSGGLKLPNGCTASWNMPYHARRIAACPGLHPDARQAVRCKSST